MCDSASFKSKGVKRCRSAFKFENKLDSLLCFFESESPPKPNPCKPLQACSVALPAKWKQRCTLWCRCRGSQFYLCSLITDIQSLLVIILDNLPAAKPHLLCNNQQLWSSLTLPAWHFKFPLSLQFCCCIPICSNSYVLGVFVCLFLNDHT